MSEEAVKVSKKVIQGDTYLYDKSTGDLYNPQTKEIVGSLEGKSFTLNNVEKTGTYKGWKFTFEIDPIFTKEEVIEENSKGEPKEWEYNFNLNWDGEIERKGKVDNVYNYDRDYDEENPDGDLVYYSKKRLSYLDCYDVLDNKVTDNAITKSYKYIFRWKNGDSPEKIIQELITSGDIKVSERYLQETKPKSRPKREEYVRGENPLWDELIDASTETKRKVEEFTEKAGLNQQEAKLYETLMEDFKHIWGLKDVFTEPRKIKTQKISDTDIRTINEIWDKNLLILSLYKFYGYSETEFNADKRELIRNINAQFEADRIKNEAKYNKARAKNPNDIFAGIEYSFHRQNTLPIGRGGLQVLLLDVDTLTYDNPISQLFIKIRDALTPVAEPISIPVATPVPDILDTKVTEYKSLASIYKTKSEEYKANKSVQLKKEVLQIKTELEQLAEEIKSIRAGKEGKGCWEGYEAFGMKKKGKKNVPNCVPKKTGGKVVSLGQEANKISEYDEVYKWSNPKRVQELAKKYLGEGATIFRSIKKDKKYMVYNPNTEKWVHFGQLGYEDFTKHKDEKRRKNYLTRTANMKGNWKNDRYSANNLSRNLLW